MYALCRHIKADGNPCGCPAIRDTHFCHNHRQKRQRAEQIPPPPDPYGWDKKPLPLVPSEDRASLELNLHIVITAFNNGHISIAKVNAFNRLFRTCEINLTHGNREQRLAQNNESDPHADLVREVVLTPEGEEIAPFREAAGAQEPATSGGSSGVEEPATSGVTLGAPSPALSLPKGLAETWDRDKVPTTSGGSSGVEEPATSGGSSGVEEPATSGGSSGASCLAETWDQDEVPTTHETPDEDPIINKSLFEGMTYKYPSIEYTYELYDRIQKRNQERRAKKREQELANHPPAA